MKRHAEVNFIALLGPEEVNLILYQFFPFLIIFLIFYALLRKSNVLGDSKSTSTKRINAAISVIIAAIVVFINPLNIPWAIVLGQFFSGAGVFLIFAAFLVVFALTISSARQEVIREGRLAGLPTVGWISFLIALGLAALALYISGVFPFLIPSTPGTIAGIDVSALSMYLALFIVILIVIGLFYLLTRPD